MTHGSRFVVGAAVLLALAPSPARAQGTTPMPLSRATVSDEVAKRTLFKHQLSSTLARDIVNACVEFACKAREMILLAVVAGHAVDATIDRDTHLRHRTSAPAS